jgi:hypothetical protein
VIKEAAKFNPLFGRITKGENLLETKILHRLQMIPTEQSRFNGRRPSFQLLYDSFVRSEGYGFNQ